MVVILIVSIIINVCMASHSFVVGRLIVCSLAVGSILLLLVLLLLLFEFVEARPVLLIVEPTRSSNDLKAEEFFTSTNFLPMLSPREPKISVVFSAANFTVSLVFWYLIILVLR